MARPESIPSELMVRAQAGDGQAFQALYASLQEMLLTYVQTLTNDEPLVQELRPKIQDVTTMILKAFLQRDLGRNDGDLSSDDLTKARECAHLVVLRYWVQRTQRDKVETLIEEFHRDYGEGDPSGEIADLRAELNRLELVARFKQGDHEAFETLYELIDKELDTYIRGQAKDVEQDVPELINRTYLDLLDKGLHHYDPQRSPSLTFVRNRARYVTIAYYREQKQWGWVRVILLGQGSQPGDGDNLRDPLDHLSQDRVPAAEEMARKKQEARLRLEAFDTLFRLTFDLGTSPPHQLLACGFKHLCRILEGDETSGRREKLPLLWPPQRIVRELSDIPLAFLLDKLEAELCETFGLPYDRVAIHLQQLRDWMTQPVSEVVDQLQRRARRAKQDWAVFLAIHLLEKDRQHASSKFQDAILGLKLTLLSQSIGADAQVEAYLTHAPEWSQHAFDQGDPHEVVTFMSRLGVCYQAEGLRYFSQALKWERLAVVAFNVALLPQRELPHKDHLLIATWLNQLGRDAHDESLALLQQALARLTQALNTLDQALEWCERLPSTAGAMSTHLSAHRQALEQVLQGDAPDLKSFRERSQQLYAAVLTETLAPKIMGDTSFTEYYSEIPEDNISHWSESVWRRVLAAISELGDDHVFDRLLNP